MAADGDDIWKNGGVFAGLAAIFRVTDVIQLLRWLSSLFNRVMLSSLHIVILYFIVLL
jgi:phage shock protein PspC (stress-responsive transcriptional regulator)